MLSLPSQVAQKIRYQLILSVSIFLLCVATNTSAAVQQSLTIPLSLEYNSNPRLSTSNGQSVDRVILVPDYSITSSQGSNQWFAQASLRLEQTSDQTISQNRNDPSLNLGWTHDYETGQFGINALVDSQSTRVSEFADSGLVSEDNTRNTRRLSLNWLNNLSERTSLTLNGIATNVTFDDLATTGLVNYRNELVNARFSYDLSEQVVTFTQLSFSRYKPQGLTGVNSEIKSADIGLTWNVNEKFNMTTSAGINEIKSEGSIQGIGRWQAMLNMQYTTLLTNSHLSLSKNYIPGSTGIINETNQITAAWTYSLSDKENLVVDISWYQNLTLNETVTKSLAANYTRQISLSWDFRLSAVHRNRNDNLTTASSNSIMTSIIYNLPDF